MAETMYVICPACGSKVFKQKFCTECGSFLNDAKPADAENSAPVSPVNPQVNAYVPQPLQALNGKKAVSDAGLTMLVDVCKKTTGTVGGDGYSESVLYRNEKTGEYQVHTYSKYENMLSEAHASYTCPAGTAEKILAYIKTNSLASLKNVKGHPLCGGDYIIKFLSSGELIRLDSGNLTGRMDAYTDISRMLNTCINEGNRCYE